MPTKSNKVYKTLIIGLGRMGKNHLRVISQDPRFEIVGLVDQKFALGIPPELQNYDLFSSLSDALKLQFDCNCPSYPNIKSLGCPLHHSGPGSSWPVDEAKKIAGRL